MKQRVPLIADPDTQFLNSLRMDPKASTLAPLLIETGKDTQKALLDMSIKLLGIFINPRLTDPHGIAVIRAAHQYRPGIPVFVLIEDEASLLSDEQMKQIGVQKAIVKPVTYRELLQIIAPSKDLFNTGETEASDPSSHSLGEVTADENGFIPIRSQDFLSGSKSLFDVFVKISPQRYVKILQTGDAFSHERVTSYLKKGVKEFHIKKEAQEQYILYCDKLVSALVGHQSIPLNFKVGQALNHGQEVMSYFRSNGVNEADLKYANGYIENVKKLITNQKYSKDELISGLLNNIAAYDHSIATAFVAALLVKYLNFTHDRLFDLVGMGAVFHDLGLYQLPVELHKEDESQMTEEQVRLYQTHPDVGAELLSNINGIDPVIVQMAGQHHMRKGLQGFPTKGRANIQLLMAEVIGLSDDIVRISEKTQQSGDMNPLKEYSFQVPHLFSAQIVSAFEKAFPSIRG